MLLSCASLGRIDMRNEKGFTLLELILYIALLAIILAAASGLLVTLLEARVKHQTITEVDEQGVQVMTVISQAIRNADSITLPAAGTSASSLTLASLDSTKNPTVISLSGTTLQMKEGTGAVVPLTSSLVTVNGVSFTNLSRTGTAGVVRIQFTLTYLNPSGRNAYNVTETYYGTAALR
jgi:prepilin-type N-terminal cleavage/methylation domain-containing protein